MRQVIRGLDRLEDAAGILAAIVMFLIMVIATTDVMLRYVFNSPFSWSYDFIGLYLMTALFYFVLSGTFAHHAHVSVDILQHYMSPVQRRICEMAVCGSAMLLFAAITYAGAGRAWESFDAGDVLAGLIPWPTWPSIALVPLGAGLMTFRLFIHLLAHISTFLTGVEIIELTPVSGSPEAAEREMVE